MGLFTIYVRSRATQTDTSGRVVALASRRMQHPVNPTVIVIHLPCHVIIITTQPPYISY